MTGRAIVYGHPEKIFVQEMISRITHRGPDGSGITRLGNAVLSHVCLSGSEDKVYLSKSLNNSVCEYGRPLSFVEF